MNDVTLIPTAPAADGLTEEEMAVAREASQRAVEELRERNRRKAEMLAIWSPALRDLEEEDEVSMHMLARGKQRSTEFDLATTRQILLHYPVAHIFIEQVAGRRNRRACSSSAASTEASRASWWA
jgi:hypothetical protein